jgi:hypothetical protein
MLNKIAKGERPAFAIDSILNYTDTAFPAKSIRMFFTSNHDENSWNKADYATMPGAIHAPFAVFTQTVKNSVPLIYSGQEEPFLRAIKFFDKDTITFNKYARANFYKKLLGLRKRNIALSADAAFKKVIVGDEKAVYAYVREKEGKKVLVILNWSNQPQTIAVKDASLHGKPYNIFMGANEVLSNTPWQIEPWGYAVYDY